MRTALLVLAALAAPARADVVAIEGATVYVTPTDRRERATILIRDGRIAAVAADAAVPAGATRIDGRGAIVTAGLIDARSRLGLTEISLWPDTVEGAFDAGVHAAYRALDSYDPRSIAIPVARTGGVTSVIATPSGGAIAGQSAFMALGDGEVDRLAIAAPAAMHAALGVGAINAGRGVALERLRELIDDARFLARRRAAYDAGQSRDLGASHLDLVALGEVASGRLPLVVEADRAADVAALIRLGEEMGVRVAIAGGAEAWRLAERLAARRVAVLDTPSENLPSGIDRRWVRDDGARVLAAAGVDLIITTGGSAHGARGLRQECGLAVRAGLPWADALASVTATPARVFGAKDRGTLAVGQVADLVVWSGDPFELSSRALRVFVGGVEQSLETHQSALLRRYRRLPGH